MQKFENLVEPFPLFGEKSLIKSKEHAEKIAKDNSYYVYVTGSILFVSFLLTKILDIELGMGNNLLLFLAILYVILGFSINKFKSRIASLTALILFFHATLTRIITKDIGGLFFINIILVSAAYRAVRATVYFHEKDNN